MRNTRLGRLATCVAVWVGVVSLGGCGSKESKWEGVYTNTKEPGTLELKPEHKGTLKMGPTSGDVTWEIAADDKIIVHALTPIEMFKTSDGLRDQEGTAWKKK